MKHHLPSIIKRHRRVRSHLHGTASRPRLSVRRSNKHLYAQLIDDQASQTIIGLHSASLAAPKATKTQTSQALGQELAKRALQKGIKAAIFDRGTYRYGGRLQALADAARDLGLKI